MAKREDLVPWCVTVIRVPAKLPQSSLQEYVARIVQNATINRAATVDGVETEEDLTRWVLLLNDSKALEKLKECLEPTVAVDLEGQLYNITIQETLPCEIPESFLTPQFMPSSGPGAPGQQMPGQYGPQAARTFYQNYPNQPPQPVVDQIYQQLPHSRAPFPQHAPDTEQATEPGAPEPAYDPQDQQPGQGSQYPGFPGNEPGPPTSQAGPYQPQGPWGTGQGMPYHPQGHGQGQRPGFYPWFQPMFNSQGMPRGPAPMPPPPGGPTTGQPPSGEEGPATGDQGQGNRPYPGYSPYGTYGGYGPPRPPHMPPPWGPQQQYGPQRFGAPPPYNREDPNVYHGYQQPGTGDHEGTPVKQAIPTEGTEEERRFIQDQYEAEEKLRKKAEKDGYNEQAGTVKQSESLESYETGEPGSVTGDMDREPEEETDRQPEMSKVLLTGLPESATEESLTDFLENTRRQGAGDVSHLELNSKDGMALVEFMESKAVDILLKKAPLKFMKSQILVERYVPPEDPPQCTVEVRGLPESASSDVLEMYFESKKRSGGGEVATVELTDDVAYVTFEDEEVAKRVAEKEKHVIANKPIDVALYIPERGGKWKSQSPSSTSSSSEVEPEEEPASKRIVEVRGLKTDTSSDLLEMYFENRRKSKGGPVENVDFDEEDATVAYITFEEEEDAANVVAKTDHVLNKTNLEVTFYQPPPKAKPEKKDKKKKHDKKDKKQEKSKSNAESEPRHCTVAVQGYPSEKSLETLEFYFENKRRSGGENMVEVTSEETEDGYVIYVTYKEEEVAERVAKKAHTFDGSELSVRLHIPPPPVPNFDDRVVISNLKVSTTKDCLFNFLEAKTQISPQTLVYGEQEGTVMVIFEEPPDFAKLKAACKKVPLEGSYLTVKEVPLTQCVMVTNFSPQTTPDTLQFYFENTRRSGGKEVKKVVKCEDEQSFLVYFQNYETVDAVTARSHTVENSQLQVKPYLECLGRCEGDGTQPKLRIPDPVNITDIEIEKVRFLTSSGTGKEAVEQQLSGSHTSVVWPKSDSEPIVLECTLTDKTKDARKLARSWTKDCQKDWNDFMKNVSLHEYRVPSEIWEPVMLGLQEIDISSPEAVALFAEKGQNCIKVVGLSPVATDVSNRVKTCIQSAEEEAERQRQQIKDVKNNIAPLKLRMLLAAKYPAAMEDKFKGLKVKINQNKNEISFEGILMDVRSAQVDMYEMMASFVMSSLETIPPSCLGLFILRQVKDYIVKMLKTKRVLGVWDVEGQTLNVCCLTHERDDCLRLLQEAVVERQITPHPASRTVLSSEQWQTRVDEIHAKYTGLCVIKTPDDKSSIQVCSTNDIVDEVVDAINTFLRQNTVHEEKISLSSGAMKLLSKQCDAEIANIAKSLAQYYVQVSYGRRSPGFDVKGTEEGIKKATPRLRALAQRVMSREHKTERPGLSKHMQTSRGRDSIKLVETELPCVIQVKGQEEEELSASFEEKSTAGSSRNVNVENSATGAGPHLHAMCKVYDDRTVFTVEGDMTDLAVDVLVNTVDRKLNLLGGLAKVITKKGGSGIGRECQAHMAENGMLDEGDVFCSRAGTLPFGMIVHVVGPKWNNGRSGEQDTLRQAIFKSLGRASERQFKSVAIPAVSCGVYGYPPKQATHVILTAVKDFFREMQETSVMEVYVCDVKPQTVNYFTEALKSVFNQFEVIQLPEPGQNAARSKQTQRKKRQESDSDSDEGPGFRPRQGMSLSGSGLSGQGSPVSLGNIKIKIIKGEMAKQQVDIIVNTTAKNLDLKSGAVSASLLAEGGPQLQQEVTQKYPKGLGGGEVAVTAGANLSCKSVFHTSMMSWDGGKDAIGALQNLMKTCLTLGQKQKATSIAFPALGTGNLNFPKDVVAKEMFMAVATFNSKTPGSTITDVRFVVYHRDMSTIKAFEEEERKWSGGQRTSQRQGRHSHGPTSLPASGSSRSLDEEGDDSGDSDSGAGDSQTRVEMIKTGDKGSEGRIGSVKVKIYQGDITREMVDCIVNSSNDELDLSKGAVSKAILKVGGKQIQEEAMRQRKNMKRDLVALTSGRGLPCNGIIHVVAQDSGPKWRDVILKCLTLAENTQITSLAFPALGTGMNTPAADIADAMFSAITAFEQTGPQFLQEVRIVVFQGDMVKDFVAALTQGAKQKQGFLGTMWKGLRGAFSYGMPKKAEKKSPMSNSFNRDPSSVVFMIFAMEGRTIDLAITRLETALAKEFTTKKFQDSVIKRFTQEQIVEIQAMGDQKHVAVEADVNAGKIMVTGPFSNVMEFNDTLHRMLREVDRIEQQRAEAEMIINLVQWYYLEITDTAQELRKYNKDLNYKIEKAFRDQQEKIVFKDSDNLNFVVDFKTMEEYPQADPTDVCTVIRRDLIKEASAGNSELPPTWSPMSDKENLKVVTLQSTDQEWIDKAAEFMQTCGGNFTVTKVDRIQNKTLFQQYQAKKKLLDQQNPAGHTNERLLWHGTAAETVDSINAHGFNRSYCGKNATAFGDGVYFAVKASYSASQTYSRPDATGVKRMYLCRVLTGQYTLGKSGMRVPPMKAQKTHTLYDSVVNNIGSPSMYIIFNDTQAYPEYLLSFK